MQLGETCYSNGSYFAGSRIKPIPLKCGLPGFILNGGQWIGPNEEVPCGSGNNSNIYCTDTSNRSDTSLSVYILDEMMWILNQLVMVGTSVVYPLVVQILTLTSNEKI